MTKRTVAAALLVVLMLGSVRGDSLPRRGFLGVRFDPVPEALHAKLGPNSGLLVGAVMANSAAADAGLQVGDVVLHVDGAIEGAKILSELDRRRENDVVSFTVLRGARPFAVDVRLTARPHEAHGSHEVIYGEVLVESHRQRTIVTKMSGPMKRPAVLYVSGLTCESMDLPDAQKHPVRSLINELTASGYVTVRVEPSGVGDSEGPPCRDIDFLAEVQAYRAALAWMKEQPYIQSDNVYLFAHSLGGAAAPLIAGHGGVRGIVAFGTIGHTWMEYELDNTRRQLQLAGASAAECDREIRTRQAIASRMFLDGWSPGRIASADPELAQHITHPTRYHGRHYQFFKQIQDTHLAEAWGSIDCPVLMMWGESDFVSSKAGHEIIVSAVNHSHPNRASLVVLEGIDHVFSHFSTAKDSYDQRMRGPFNSIAARSTVDWMAQHHAVEAMKPVSSVQNSHTPE